jgi:hypothetical protein
MKLQKNQLPPAKAGGFKDEILSCFCGKCLTYLGIKNTSSGLLFS